MSINKSSQFLNTAFKFITVDCGTYDLDNPLPSNMRNKPLSDPQRYKKFKEAGLKYGCMNTCLSSDGNAPYAAVKLTPQLKVVSPSKSKTTSKQMNVAATLDIFNFCLVKFGKKYLTEGAFVHYGKNELVSDCFIESLDGSVEECADSFLACLEEQYDLQSTYIREKTYDEGSKRYSSDDVDGLANYQYDRNELKDKYTDDLVEIIIHMLKKVIGMFKYLIHRGCVNTVFLLCLFT